ncbi:LacI family DNA-binding transcriptional regulator [Streptomyces sp. NBC_01618]|uniref:LacI family DNA-binding transcriptional regulator n=1 Tax=Streptomyces sp. NBC_01618 TaxID=2975900 RepID=UPI00386E8B49|nr:LacI family transcriptional regulator [Streptomyces sp. NBC_01618]
MKRATIYSIAEVCGVSASTVSRAFSRPEVVNPEVRELIHAKARELGYRPNKAARELATGRTGMIGLLVHDVANPFFPPLVRAIQRAADEMEAAVMLVDADESSAREVGLIKQLKGQVDGLVIASPRSSSALQEAAEGLPAVVVNRRMRGFPSVVCDNTAALTEAGRHLEDLGHRKVALMCGPSASWAARQRAATVRAWAQGTRVTLVELGSFAATFEGGREAARALVGSGATAAFAFDDLMACGVLSGLAEAGVQVPGGCSVVGCDDVLLARAVTPQLTTVTAPVDRLGRAAVDALRRCIAGEQVRDVRMDGSLTLRGSTGRPA